MPFIVGVCPSLGDREPEDAGAELRRRNRHDRRLRGLWREDGQDGTREKVTLRQRTTCSTPHSTLIDSVLSLAYEVYL